MDRYLSGLIYLLLMLMSVDSLNAQTISPGIDMNDPDAILVVARALNGLDTTDLKPWHLKASYDIFDDDGKPLAKGTFEEWWAAKDTWKQSYAGDHYSGTVYRSPAGIELYGPRTPWPESQIARILFFPIEDNFKAPLKPGLPKTLSDLEFPLTCIEIRGSDTRNIAPFSYCFDKGTANLRLSSAHFVSVAYAKNGLFQGHRVGIETRAQVDHHSLLNVHVESLTSAPEVDAAFVAPKVPVSKGAPLAIGDPSVKAPKLVSSSDPLYPESLAGSKTNGDADLIIRVDKAGRVTDAHVLECDAPAFGESARTAVHTWRFQPAEMNGQPVEVDMYIALHFHLK